MSEPVDYAKVAEVLEWSASCGNGGQFQDALQAAAKLCRAGSAIEKLMSTVDDLPEANHNLSASFTTVVYENDLADCHAAVRMLRRALL